MRDGPNTHVTLGQFRPVRSAYNRLVRLIRAYRKENLEVMAALEAMSVELADLRQGQEEIRLAVDLETQLPI